MIIECPRCKTRYSVKDSEVPNGGAPVECIECGNIFTIFIEPLPLILTRISREEAEIEFQKFSSRQTVQNQAFSGKSDLFEKSVSQPKKKESILDETEMFRNEFEMPIKQKKQDFARFPDDFGFQKQTPKTEKPDIIKQDNPFDLSGLTSKPKPIFEDSFSIQSGGGITQPKKDIKPADDFRNKSSQETTQSTSSLEEFFNIPKTPEDKLRNLASRVVNELKMYYPEESDESAKTGKIPVNLLNEIKKALQFYRQEAVKDADWDTAVVFFRDAINTIIGKGKILFR